MDPAKLRQRVWLQLVSSPATVMPAVAGASAMLAAWAFELGSPNGLMRQGWTRNSLKEGDVVTINGTRARDGSTNSNARNVTTADGKRMFAGSSEDATP